MLTEVLKQNIVAVATLLALYVGFGVVSTLISRRSQVDAWAESNPKLAALMKLMRGLGFDPWIVVQAVWLWFKSRLPPEPPVPPTKKPPGGGLKGIGSALVCLMLLSGCSSVRDVVWPTAVKCSPPPTQVLNEAWQILKNDPGGTLSERGLSLLEQLAKKYGPSTIACAVSHFADLLSAPGDIEGNRVQSKAIDFQQKLRVRAEFEEPPAAPAPCEPTPAPAPVSP